MASTNSTFVAKNGIIANGGLIYAVGGTTNVGINNTSPDAALTVTGTANVQGNVVITGTVNAGANVNVTGSLTSTINVNTVSLYANVVNASSNIITTNVYASFVNVTSNVTSNLFYSGTPSIYSAINSTSIGTTGIITAGGNVSVGNVLSVSGNTNFAGSVVIQGSLSVTGPGGVTTSLTATGGIVPNANISYSLGNQNYYWQNVYAVNLFGTSFSGTSANATNLNSQPGSYYTNASNHTTGILPYAQLGSAVVNTSGNFTLSGNTIHNANLVANSTLYLGTSTILYANGSTGTSGQVLTVNSTGGPYWSTVSGGGGGTITGVTAGNGLTGGGTSGTVTLTALAANTTLYVSSSGIAVNTTTIASSNPGSWANATNGLGSFINTSGNFTLSGNVAYNANLVANSTLYLGTSTILYANGSTGTSGQVLTVNSTGGPYWSTVSGGGGGTITGVTAGNGLTGGGTSGTVTLTALAANTTLYVSSSGIAVNTTTIASSNPGSWANATNGFGISGTAANANTLLTYTWAAPGVIGSTTANSATFTTVTATTFTGSGSGLTGTSTTLSVNNSVNFNGVSMSTVNTAITSNAATAYTNAVAYVGTNPISSANSTNGLAINGTAANATLFAGYSWASPAAIGGTTANSGIFTTVTATDPGSGTSGAFVLRTNTSNTAIIQVVNNNNQAQYSYMQANSSGWWNWTANASFTGNVSVYGSFVGSGSGLTGTGLSFTAGTANNATNLGGVAAANYVNTSGNYTISGNHAFTGTGTTINYGAGAYAVGYRDIPQNIQNTSYTTAASDSGGHIFNAANTGTLTYTIANNATVAWANGAAISIINGNTATLTIAGAGNVTIQLAGTTTTGSRTLVAGATATCIRVAVDRWFVGGAGVS